MQMLRSLKDMQGYAIGAQDGKIGHCRDFLFGEADWTVRYVVADSHKWLPGRKVLISPISIGDADGRVRILDVGLTRDQVKNAPPLDSDAPVSRQYEIMFNCYYDWAHYWGGPLAWGPYRYPRLLHRGDADRRTPDTRADNPVLRSVDEVVGYHIRGTDGDIGHVDDFIVDQNTWIIRYLVIDTGNRLPGGKRVLVSPAWVEQVIWAHRRMTVGMTRAQVRNSPAYDPSLPVNRGYETALYDFYGRPAYW